MPPYFVDGHGVLREMTEAEWLAYPVNANEIALPVPEAPGNSDNTADDGLS
jgi:hypothetical protein